MVVNLDFFIKEAWLGIRRNGVMAFIAFLTMTICLCVVGLVLIGLINTNRILKTITGRLEMMVYVKMEITESQTQELIQDLSRLPQIKQLSFKHRNEAWQTFKRDFVLAMPFAGIEDNPLPHAVRVGVYDIQVIPSLAEIIQAYPEVDRVVYGGDLVDRIRKFSEMLRFVGLSFSGFLGVATLFIVMNTIRLTVLARKDEIEIMQLVGATSSFIRWPFIFEGVLMGFMASLMAIAVLWGAYRLFLGKIQASFIFVPVFLELGYFHWIWAVLILAGVGVGMLGGYFSVTRSLN